MGLLVVGVGVGLLLVALLDELSLLLHAVMVQSSRAVAARPVVRACMNPPGT
ncbi:hypothetical protein [Streptomyces sp. NBC_00162]|uniref:hypothetical protein n=1 Tax=Streptomyces sp. NBC_00162 TaxID=2903629 RepID=UPI00214CCC14|nr:hypothetical protein [Streptomyces sp. NBC_00162]UUU37657.1 hypothetical protein JIW86_01230 [Streptomyces sp. NBC_00162]